YGSSAEITTKTKRHFELKNIISRLADEWTQTSTTVEQQNRDFEEAKKALEAEYARYKWAN
ncbi:MAG TPA: hypothetical protein VLH15_03415, partial [Dehalococcoidales bacterium]|nr:hypothetical protein [Dehalococcoidales bacterium]